MLGSLIPITPLFVGGRAHQELPGGDRHHLQSHTSPEGLLPGRPRLGDSGSSRRKQTGVVDPGAYDLGHYLVAIRLHSPFTFSRPRNRKRSSPLELLV